MILGSEIGRGLRFHNMRVGFATNSSSSHSLLYLPGAGAQCSLS